MRATRFNLKRHSVTGVVAIAWTVLASTATIGAEIHKCAGAGGAVSYQTDACASGQRQLALLTTVSNAPRGDTSRVDARDEPMARASGNAAQPFRGKQWLPYERRSIAPGMTDDEVLNSSGGGVPTRIARSREGRAWRETWIYETRGGTVRALQFVNGRLESTEDAADIGQIRLAGTP
jgi:hypothetical protein